MSNVIGLDLGTNSIGWALRNPNRDGNQIEKFGVLTFKKGVGIDKTGEYSYAAERTKKRSVRRLYQARKYRLWDTLRHLIQLGYCPLTIEALNKWRHYDKQEAIKNSNGGRVYPVEDHAFDAWIKLDFNGDGKPDYTSPYQLRKELATVQLDMDVEMDRAKLGRALYHIAQRRGFKSSRKSGEDLKDGRSEDSDMIDLQVSEKKKNRRIDEEFQKYPEAKTIGHLFALLEDNNERVRERIAQFAIRENYKDEIRFIFENQGLGVTNKLYELLVESGRNKNDGSIFYKIS
ncbi:MAG: type II CRISPR RNA-guided endonuclease Cas9, partial [Bacteroidota bacterium]